MRHFVRFTRKSYQLEESPFVCVNAEAVKYVDTYYDRYDQQLYTQIHFGMASEDCDDNLIVTEPFEVAVAFLGDILEQTAAAQAALVAAEGA